VHALHCSVAQRSWLIPLSVSTNSDESGKQSLYSEGDQNQHQNLIFFHWPIANLALKCHANPFGSFCAKLLRNRQTDKRINKDENITSLTVIRDEYRTHYKALYKCPVYFTITQVAQQINITEVWHMLI